MIQLEIKVLEQLSGIKAHTIRIWEHRFNIFRPSRTSGNRRLYTLDDLKFLLDIAILSRHGYSISKLSNLPHALMEREIRQLPTGSGVRQANINRLLVAFVDEDITLFEDTLSSYVAENGIHQCIRDIIIPFINKVGLFYYIDQELATHLVVTTLRKKLLYATDAIEDPIRSGRSAVLFLPVKQHFDLILLYLSYELKLAGIKVFYLGTNIKTEILRTAVNKYLPDLLITYVSSKSNVSNNEKMFLSDVYKENSNLIITTSDSNTTAFIKGIPVVHYLSVTAHITAL